MSFLVCKMYVDMWGTKVCEEQKFNFRLKLSSSIPCMFSPELFVTSDFVHQDDAIRNLFSTNTPHEYTSRSLLTFLVCHEFPFAEQQWIWQIVCEILLSSNFKIHSFGWKVHAVWGYYCCLANVLTVVYCVMQSVQKSMSVLWACVQMMFFSLAVLTYGTAVPSGQFVPGIMIGATYGRLVGILVVNASSKDSVDEGTYVLWSFHWLYVLWKFSSC